MTRFSVALLCLMSGVSGLMVVKESLHDVAKRESMRNPLLRKRDLESKGDLERKLVSMATPKRNLAENDNNGNYNGNNANANGYWYDASMDQDGVGFDITSYAVKYTQCATVLTYSDELAEDENSDTVLAAERFALFRLCPKDQCSSFSSNGCGRNYGEYLVSLDQFLTSMLEYQETRVSGYCMYCQKCAAIESAKAFWAAAYNNRDYALKIAKSSYTTWYTSYLESYYANSGNNNNNNGNNYQQVDSNLAAQRYYQQVRNSNNYANQYASTYYGNYNNANANSNANYGTSSSSSSSSSQATQQYSAWNQDMWRAQNSQQVQSSNQDAWNSMGSPAGSFYGKTILNGFYDEDGIFNQVFGYFNFNGEYVSLEDAELVWDEGLWGELPELWTDVTEETESCNYQYAGSCYNQYEACMQILQDRDYQEYQQYQQQQQNNGQNNGQKNNAAAAEGRSTLKDFIRCVEVEPYYGQNGNQYSINQYYYQNGGTSSSNGQKQQYNCYNNDENCQKYNQYQENMNRYQEQADANRRYFVGPHCGSDTRTISLAVYSDQYCSVLDESSTVESILGYQPNTESIDLFPDECMSCLRDNTQVWYEGEELYDLEPMCSMLYQFSGKCNKHLNATEYKQQAQQEGNYAYDQYQQAASSNAENAQEQYEYQYKQMYQSLAQSQNEKAVCSFIESLASNTYNEHGEVTAFDSFSYGWKGALKTPQIDSGVLAGLIITAMLAISMGIAACVLHGALARKNIPWKPRRSKGEDPTDLARQNSGITMGRSRSGVGANPLL